MAWVPPSSIAPNAKSAVGATVPTSTGDAIAAITSAVVMWVTNLTISNSGTDACRFNLTNGAGDFLIKALLVPAGATAVYEWPFVELTGCKWYADVAGLTATLQGYT